MRRTRSRGGRLRCALLGLAVVGFLSLGTLAGITGAQGATSQVTAARALPMAMATPTATTTTSNVGSAVVQPPTTPRKPLAAGWVVLAVAGAGVIALGLSRIPDRVLQSAGPACRLEES